MMTRKFSRANFYSFESLHVCTCRKSLYGRIKMFLHTITVRYVGLYSLPQHPLPLPLYHCQTVPLHTALGSTAGDLHLVHDVCRVFDDGDALQSPLGEMNFHKYQTSQEREVWVAIFQPHHPNLQPEKNQIFRFAN